MLLPIGIGQGVKSWLLENGAARVEIENVAFNPFTGTFSLQGFQATTADEETSRLSALEGDIEWMPLWDTRVHIRALTVKGARIAVEYSETGALKVSGIAFPETPDSEPADASGWGVAIDHLQISESDISYRDPQIATSVRIQRLELSNLTSWKPEQTARLSLDGTVDKAGLHIEGDVAAFSASPGFSGKILLKDLHLQPYSGALRPHLAALRGRLSIDSSVRVALNQSGDLSVAQTGELSLADLRVAAAPGEFDYKSLAWDGELRLSIDAGKGKLGLDSSGSLAQGAASVKLAEPALGYQDAGLTWTGKLNLEEESTQTLIGASGRLKLQAPRLEAGAEKAALEAKLVDLTQDRMQLQRDRQSGAVTLSHQGSLGIEQLAGRSVNDRLSQKTMRWQGALTLASSAERLRLDTQGTLSSNGLVLSVPGTDLDLNQASLQWAGKIGYGLAGGQTQLETLGDLELRELLVDAPKYQQELLAFDRLMLEKIRIQNPQLMDVAAITFENLLFARRPSAEEAGQDTPPALVQSKRSRLSDFLYSDTEGLYVKKVEHENLNATFRRNPKGEFYLVGVIDLLIDVLTRDEIAEAAHTDKAKSKPRPAAKSGAATQALRIRADEVLATGESSLTFVDHAVSPPYQASLNFQKLQIGLLDTAAPGQSSPFELSAKIGKHAQLNLKGSARFFAERLSGKIGGRLDALELPPLSPYLAAALGYDVTSGQMDADIDIRIDKGKLSGTNRLEIRELEIVRLEQAERERLGTKKTVPLETGLAILKNRDDTIELELPIRGDINKPDFDPTDAINQAIARGMREGAKTYLGAALFPFGTLITVAEVAGKAAMQIRLDPVVFAPASTALDKTARDYLKKVAQVLGKRPDLDMRICGVAVEDDHEALARLDGTKTKAEAEAKRRAKKSEKGERVPVSDQQLTDLAMERGAVVKDHLIRDHGIKPNRLIACRAKIDKKDSDGNPRADLLL